MYFYVRNRFHVHQAKFNNKALALLHYSCFLMAFATIVLFYQKTDKFKKIGFIFWPAKDAFYNNFNATPVVILTKLQAKTTFPLTQTLITNLKNILTLSLTPFTTTRTRRAANA